MTWKATDIQASFWSGTQLTGTQLRRDAGGWDAVGRDAVGRDAVGTGCSWLRRSCRDAVDHAPCSTSSNLARS
uniref:Uncharacterized protein n=1 Tax=Globodera rostochiensis TaxID=31243 RepID=A0A914IFS2_GLORO